MWNSQTKMARKMKGKKWSNLHWETGIWHPNHANCTTTLILVSEVYILMKQIILFKDKNGFKVRPLEIELWNFEIGPTVLKWGRGGAKYFKVPTQV